MERIYTDRADAGRRLGAALLRKLRGSPVLVLGLPRGGVAVAAEVARLLSAPHDALVVRKVGAPFQPELALGAVGPGGIQIRNEPLLASLSDGAAYFELGVARERLEVERRERTYREGRAPLDLAGRDVVLVDDGIATGATARCAVAASRALGAKSVTVAVPVAPGEVLAELAAVADDVVCLEAPRPFRAVGAWYEHFEPVEDDEVRELLRGGRPA